MLARLAVVLVNVIVVTHSAGWEYERLLVHASIALRFAVLWLFAAVIGTVGDPWPSSSTRRQRRRRDLDASETVSWSRSPA